MPGRRFTLGLALSVLGHLALASAAKMISPPDRAREGDATETEVEVVEATPVEPPAEPIAEPIVEPDPEEPRPVERIVSRRPTGARADPAAPATATPGDDPTGTGDAPVSPAFGVEMSSVSGSGPGAPAGETLGARPAARGTGSTPSAATSGPGAVEVLATSKLPLPRGRCDGRYTDEARAAGVEGTVVVDLVVGASGRTRDIRVVKGLSHGLTEAAVAAVKACRFTPGERQGRPVAVRLRAFKIRFVLRDGG